MTMIRTAGIFIFNTDNKLLICHATNARWNQWSIPKGLVEENELPMAAALRETYEECGVILEQKDLIELPSVHYKSKKKTLLPFLSSKKIDLKYQLNCISMIPGTDQKEIDKYKYIALDQSYKYIHESQQQCISLFIKYIHLINELNN